MQRSMNRPARAWATLALAVALALQVFAIPSTATADPGPPWDGNPISAGLGPTYGEEWCAPVGTENVPQTPPLADIPYAAIECTLDQFQAEAAAAGIPHRMDSFVIGQSALGRDLYGVVVNGLETREQRRDFERWQEIRAIELTDPAAAQALVASYGDEVKMPIFIQANIHGGEREGTDTMMQVLRDLVTLPYGTNEIVDEILDHAILIVIPTENPDGRVAGTRSNGNGLDMNRDFLVQSQSEVRASVALQLEWLATVGLDMHGYVNPTLIDGLTKPHNPGIEYDLFLKWNQPRLDANEAALAAIGFGITRPVNQWNADAEDSPPPVGPAYAEGWDDWGPLLHPDVHGLLRQRQLDRGDVQRLVRRTDRVQDGPVHRLLLFGGVLAGAPQRDDARPAGDVPPRRDRRGPSELL